MTQLTIAQWLSTNSTTQEKPMSPRYIIVNSKKFMGHYDILDTHTNTRMPRSTRSVRWLTYEVIELNKSTVIK